MLEQVLQWCQILLSILTLAGGAFTIGRVFERMANMQKDLDDFKLSLFGPYGDAGIFIRRSEADLLFKQADRARGEFDTRLSDLASRMGGLEQRMGGD